MQKILWRSQCPHQLCASLRAQPSHRMSAGASSASEPDEGAAPERKPGARKRTLRVTTPPLPESVVKEMKTAVGVHLGGNAVSWARLDRGGSLLAWDSVDLAASTRRAHPTKLFQQAMEMKQLLPPGDVYVLEDRASGGHQSQQQQASLQSGSQQLSAMLLTLINLDSAPAGGAVDGLFKQRVYFLRARLSARLFRTMVGSERVSARSVVEDMLSPGGAASSSGPHRPAVLAPPALVHGYRSSADARQENLCRALLLTMTFLELAVRRNPEAISYVSGQPK
ncbi:uncharacterized protein LOC134538375 [Bacillus rossius redtenbacheri]|uniref:uncharacterized protein LOC134538375 n=1 Tax=Bacillus rossius redtenbacheri TaxID=93214 RepID=UPI002FDD1D89